MIGVRNTFKPPTSPSEKCCSRKASDRATASTTAANESTERLSEAGTLSTDWCFVRICFSTLPPDQDTFLKTALALPPPSSSSSTFLSYCTVAKGCADAVISGCVMPGYGRRSHAPSDDSVASLHLFAIPAPALAIYDCSGIKRI